MFDRGYLILMGTAEKYFLGKVFSEHIPCGFYDFSHLESQPFQSLPFAVASHYGDKYKVRAGFSPTWVKIMPCDVLLTPAICEAIIQREAPPEAPR